MDPQPDLAYIARLILAQQLSWSASLSPTVWIGQDEYALIVEDSDLNRAKLWRGQEMVARVDLSTLTVEVGASC